MTFGEFCLGMLGFIVAGLVVSGVLSDLGLICETKLA